MLRFSMVKVMSHDALASEPTNKAIPIVTITDLNLPLTPAPYVILNFSQNEVSRMQYKLPSQTQCLSPLSFGVHKHAGSSQVDVHGS
jgi:hypothetical protein